MNDEAEADSAVTHRSSGNNSVSGGTPKLRIVRRPESSVIEPPDIRRKLREFLGEAQYRKFVAKLPRIASGSRLLYWQQQAWERFEAENPSLQLSLADIVAAFRVCHLHDSELVQKSIPVVQGCFDYAPEFWESRAKHCPNAPLPFMSTEGREMTEIEVLVWYCPDCEAIDQQRNASS